MSKLWDYAIPAITEKKAGIFFVTDVGFVLPTIASTIEIRRKTPAEAADVRVILVDFEHDLASKLRDYLMPKGIYVDAMRAEFLQSFDQRMYNKTHVPPATLARFFMLDCVPDIYSRILYLDGDVWLDGDLQPLLSSHLGPGTFAAAEDKSYYYQLQRGGAGAKIRQYFGNLGIDGTLGYFNAGVLMSDAATWRTLSAEAFGFFRENIGICMYHDQSALNAVAQGRRVRLSPRWNFLFDYFAWGIRPKEPPPLIHFAGGGKPWRVPHPYQSVYQGTFKILSNLGLKIPPTTAQEIESYHRFVLKEKIKGKTIYLNRMLRRRRLYKSLVESSIVR